MLISKQSALVLCLALVLVGGLLPTAARAEGGGSDADATIRLYATAGIGLIGKVEADPLGRLDLAINGRSVQGEQAIWEGDLIETAGHGRVRVLLEHLGQVTLTNNATVRMTTTTRNSADDYGSHPALVASLLRGELRVALAPHASAYVQARGETFESSQGADFLVGIRQTGISLNTKTGEVRAETSQRRYTISSVGFGTSVGVKTNNLVNLKVQITDEMNRPARDIPVTFALGDGAGHSVGRFGQGTLAGSTFTATTDANGMATATFTAGSTPGTSPLTIVVAGTGSTWTGEIQVVPGTWTPRTKTLTAVAVASAVTVVAVTAVLINEKEPITAQPPGIGRP